MKKSGTIFTLILVILSLVSVSVTVALTRDVYGTHFGWISELSDLCEKMSYCICGLSFISAYSELCKKTELRRKRILLTVVMASVFTLQIFVVNNYLHYVEWNAKYNCRGLIGIWSFMRSDIHYHVGLAEFRYPAVFFVMFSLLAVSRAMQNLKSHTDFGTTYPRLCNGVSLHEYIYQDNGEVEYGVTVSNGKSFTISENLMRALIDADGTHPISKILPQPEFDELIYRLYKERIITNKRFEKGRPFNTFALFLVGEKAKIFKPVCDIINHALPYAATIGFIVGISLRLVVGTVDIFSFSMPLLSALFLLSIVLHEAAHFASAVAYGQRVDDIGLLLFGIIPIGAYVGCRKSGDISQNENIQVCMAGIEANILLAGLLLIMSCVTQRASYSYFMAGIMNIILAISNLMPAYGSDGESAMSIIIGTDDVSKLAREVLSNSQRRRQYLESGISGTISLVAFVLTYIAKAVLPLYIIINVVYLVTSILV